jgi:hypothetical protein
VPLTRKQYEVLPWRAGQGKRLCLRDEPNRMKGTGRGSTRVSAYYSLDCAEREMLRTEADERALE